MPSGKVHTTASVALATMFTFSDIGRWAGLGALIGVVLSPDLDVDTGFIGFRFLRKIPRVGWILAGIWRALWLPYAKLVKHRSWVSHMPIVGTVIRLGYLGAFVVPVLWGLHVEAPPDHIMLDIFIGLAAADTTHWLMDKL